VAEGLVAMSPLGRACNAIRRVPDRKWSAAALETAAGVPIATLRRAFRRTLGITPHEFVSACRRDRMLSSLREGASIADAIHGAGYGSVSRVYARRDNGVTLASYRKGGLGATMEWTSVASPIGRILVAATARGVSFVAIGATDAELVRALEHEYPRAAIKHGASPRLKRFASSAREVAFGRPIVAEIPADIVGTAFQWRVWRALTRIPPGATRSYSALAKAIGSPTSVRAAARACATNPTALIIPCHRVVGTDGQLRGYRWGLAAKKKLLEVENVSPL
jgi:AraC family transcriptional regulator of adaptative response/methylated-DNA-[protein]-cysteine methyltransferase